MINLIREKQLNLKVNCVNDRTTYSHLISVESFFQIWVNAKIFGSENQANVSGHFYPSQSDVSASDVSFQLYFLKQKDQCPMSIKRYIIYWQSFKFIFQSNIYTLSKNISFSFTITNIMFRSPTAFKAKGFQKFSIYIFIDGANTIIVSFIIEMADIKQL